jgi:hypothetical protein
MQNAFKPNPQDDHSKYFFVKKACKKIANKICGKILSKKSFY